QPLDPSVLEFFGTIEDAARGASEVADELPGLFRAAHEVELERLENPRRGEHKWDVSNKTENTAPSNGARPSRSCPFFLPPYTFWRRHGRHHYDPEEEAQDQGRPGGTPTPVVPRAGAVPGCSQRRERCHGRGLGRLPARGGVGRRRPAGGRRDRRH